MHHPHSKTFFSNSAHLSNYCLCNFTNPFLLHFYHCGLKKIQLMPVQINPGRLFTLTLGTLTICQRSVLLSRHSLRTTSYLGNDKSKLNKTKKPKFQSQHQPQEQQAGPPLHWEGSSIHLLIRSHRSASGKMKIPDLVSSLSSRIDEYLLTSLVLNQSADFLFLTSASPLSEPLLRTTQKSDLIIHRLVADTPAKE